MTAEGYKTFINGSVMASFMEGIVASILEEKKWCRIRHEL